MILNKLRHSLRDRRGLSAVEGALTIPVVLTAMAVGYDLSTYGTTQSRVREVAFRIADFAASDGGLGINGRLTSVADMRSAARDMLTPLKACDVAGVILSGVTNPNGNAATIAWQEKWHYPSVQGSADCVGVASSTMVSGLGAVGQTPKFASVLPNQATRAMVVKQKDAVIIAEVVFRDVQSVIPNIFHATLPTTHTAAGAARVRSQIP
ncbi:MAG: hypothetical protein JNK67_32325 [Alphaproteobacteria bacterium]|nr:hypothetical protein [Alphaproteobacteria bacterium]